MIAACDPKARGLARWRCAIGWAVYVAIAAIFIAFAGAAAAQAPAAAAAQAASATKPPDGAALYATHCASCHGTTVSPVELIQMGIIKKIEDGVKIMGSGELTRKLTVQANKFTATAKEKIEAAGGKAEVI